MNKKLFLLFLLIIIAYPKLIYALEQTSNEDPFDWLKNIFNKGLQTVEDLGNYLLNRLIKTLLFIGRIIYIIVAIVGLILWFSGLQPHKGKRFTYGAAILAIVVEMLAFSLA